MESAELGLVPFKKIAVANRVLDKTIYMTTAGATEEQYNATNGEIFEMICLMKKDHILYDTRYFESQFYETTHDMYDIHDRLKEEFA